MLLKTAPGKFSPGKFACFRLKGSTGRATGAKMRGITKLLGARVYTSSVLQYGKAAWRGAAWKGQKGGLRRGKAVDAQVSRLANVSEKARRGAKMLKFTRLAFAALSYHDLVPVGSQRVVLNEARRVGTAADIVCMRGESELVIVELKCGFVGDRSVAAIPRAMMKAPLTKAVDCALHRHLAQLAVTTALFTNEVGTLRALKNKGVTKVGGVLLYIDDAGSEKHELPAWWRKRGIKILDALC